ncbi:MAG: DUF58 domain-containing protein [Coriobacteriia bacterium]|nr:DUF58 domain-containing protein [Coriobacteriia bacterium]
MDKIRERFGALRDGAGQLAQDLRSRADQQGEKERDFQADLRLLKARQAVVIVALLAVFALPPVFVNHPIGYVPLVSFVLLLALSWGYLQVLKRGFLVESRFEEGSCVRGSSVLLPLVLKNRSKLPILRACPQLYVTNPYGGLEHEAQVVSVIDAMDDADLSMRVQLGHVGVYASGMRGVVLFDPLMLFHTYIDSTGHAELVSTPQSFSIDSVEFSNLALRESHAPVRTVVSDDVDYAGTRDYEFGDPLKSVHWKLSARTGDLQTRLFEENVNSSTAVIMDFHGPDSYQPEQLMSCTDVVVEIGIAVVRLAKERGMDAHLRYVNNQGHPETRELPNVAEMEDLVRTLPSLSPAVPEHAALDLVAEEMEAVNGGDNVVLCTSSLTRTSVAQVLGARAHHMSVCVVLAMPRDLVRDFYKKNSGLMSELQAADVPCIVLSDSAELQEFDSVG